ncbi:DNA-binding protein [Streptomyces sp. TSRI0384-2]|nr:ComEA family DNA-binding protein [Streptomyces sp. TSRI0384-2]PJM85070.1 DNA-binding protein [Streptomyces sp. TSRI0384-2]
MVLGSSFFGVGVRNGQGNGGERADEAADAVRERARALLGAGAPADTRAGPAGGGAAGAEAADAEREAWDDDRRILGHPWWADGEEPGAPSPVTGRPGAARRTAAPGRDGGGPVAGPGGEEPEGAGSETGAGPVPEPPSARRPEGGPPVPDARSALPDEAVAPHRRRPAGGAARPRGVPARRRSVRGDRPDRPGGAGVPGLLRARCGMEWRSVAALVVVVAVAVVWAAQHFWTGRPEAVRAPETVAQGASRTPGTADGPAVTGPAPASPPPSPSAGPLVVDVSGKVARPGVHRLPAGSRVEDALEAAGGVRPGTDTSGLNRARLLTDGEQVAVGVDPAPGAGPVAGPGAAGVAGPVSLGTATAEQLETLPGVGPVLAAAIIAHRTESGGFQSVDQLRDVRGIGDRRFEDLRELVRP